MPSSRPTSLLPCCSGSSRRSTSVSSTASRTGFGSSSSCCFARRVSLSSGKPQLAPHVIEAEQGPVLHVLLALAQVGKRRVVLQHRERLLDRVPLVGRDHDGSRPSLPRDHDVLVACLNVVEQFGQPPPRFGERDDTRHVRHCTEN